eukprot:CAMPEP_0185034294 /NCGR_PEP_ID=MMETSP1103-20130426/24034_1 /TAXON_ID=36769 /ORGANISM="Paraphysomonas bandaiensis, Strain Caron Lab Isolate" /LENGTH=1149 /DNA_ID=CAMNT_0027570895 /DNA_START=22 /DNA_END=3471 /DNA_ORIENTATION=+
MEDAATVMPRGVPTLSYIRVLSQDDSQASDIAIDGDFVSIVEPGQPTTRHEVAHVFERGITDQELCEATIGQEAGAAMDASLNPIAAFVEDAASAVIFMVGSKFTKKWQFLKRVFLPFLGNELFACLSDKEQQGKEVFEYEATLSAFEIQNEVISDLLRPANRGLAISVTPESGAVVKGIHKEKISSEASLRQLFVDACDNRSSHTLPPGASIDTSCVVWDISLSQKEGDDDLVLFNTSRLLIVDVPAVNPLCMTTQDARMFEGPNIHKSLFTFADCVRKLANPVKIALAPFRSSKLTHFVGELLGGNAIVVAIGLLHSGEPAVSRKTLELMNHLTNARHYPISGKEMSEIVQGLMMKYRSMILNMEDEVATAKLDIPMDDKNKEREMEDILAARTKSIEDRMAELQKDLAQAIIERTEAKEDTAKVYEMLEIMKAKYTTLIEERKEQNEELLKVETEKLEVARALVDMKMELSNFMEEAEKEKFEMTSNILALKNELFEIDEKEQLARLELSSAQKELTEANRALTQEKENCTQFKTQLNDIREQLEKVEARNLDLSAELVTLLNTKDTLTAELASARKQVADMEETLNMDSSDITALRSANSDLEAKVNDLENENDQLQRQLTEERFEIHRMKIELEKSKLEFEQSASEYLKDKDAVLKRETQAVQAELHHLQNEKEQLMVTLRREERKKRDAVRDAERAIQEREEAVARMQAALEEASHIREAYRNHLNAELKSDEKSEKDGPIRKPIESKPSTAKHISRPGSSRSQLDGKGTWEEVVESYISNERALYGQLDVANETIQKLTVSRRQLFDHYRAAIDVIEDNCPTCLPEYIIPSEFDTARPMTNTVGNNERKKESQEPSRAEMRALETRVKVAEDALLQEQEKTSAVVAKYRRSLQKIEKEASQKTEENAFLRERIKIMTESGVGDQSGTERVQDMMTRMHAQIDELKKKGGNNAELRKQLIGLKAQCGVLQEENQEMRALLLRNGGGPGSGSKTEAYMRKLEENADTALLHQLREVESRNSSLTSRNAGLEEELRTYKVYMRDTVSQYKRQIKALQAQLASYNVPNGNNHSRPLQLSLPDQSGTHTDLLHKYLDMDSHGPSPKGKLHRDNVKRIGSNSAREPLTSGRQQGKESPNNDRFSLPLI